MCHESHGEIRRSTPPLNAYSALGTVKQKNNLDAGGLAGMLQQEQT